MSRRVARSWRLALCLSALVTSSTLAQESQIVSRGPRFIQATWGSERLLDASASPVLRRRLSLDLRGTTLGEALQRVTREAQLEITYSPRLVPLNRRVSLQANDITVAAALTEVLLDIPVDVWVTSTGGLALVRRTLPPPGPPGADSGSVVGTVRDSATGGPIAGAMVSIKATSRGTTTDMDGRYRFTGLASGAYTLQARFIGYTPSTLSVELAGVGEVTADFALARSAQPLQQVVVTGTILPTEVKALPTPITVITEDDIENQHARTTLGILREAMPGAVAWDQGTQPQQTTLSVRGASSLSQGSGTMKVYLDGIELADRSNAAIDPNSIGRIEVIRGPQAAAIYGSDAIGGVLQVFTRRGDPRLTRPEAVAQVGLGMIESPYDGYSHALRQDYSASVLGGTSGVTYSAGGGYTHAGDWVPEGQSASASAYGSVNLSHGPLTVDLMARHYQQETPSGIDPRLGRAWALFATPMYREYLYQEQTAGTSLRYAVGTHWQHNLTFGIDRIGTDAHQTQPRLVTQADTLLFLFERDRTKASLRYNSSLRASLGDGVFTSVTAGVDHYTLRSSQFLATGALNTSGTIRTADGQPPQAARDVTNNTGYFTQVQGSFRDNIFVTGGLRLEQNSNFGSRIGTPVTFQAGASYIRAWDATTLKVRGSYGEAIHPPDPGQRDAIAFATNRQLANPLLGPERQAGWDAGVDITFATKFSLGATYYHQVARELIALVFLGTASQDFQFQNVGRVKNSGLEIEGTLRMGSAITVKGQYAYTRSRVEDLGPNYTGDLRATDQVFSVPRHTAGTIVTLAPWSRTRLDVGVAYVGGWTNYDYYAQFSCFGGTGPCKPSTRDYLKEYPAFAKVELTIAQELTPAIGGFASIENVTNNNASEYGNFNPVLGRVTSVGVKVRY